MTTNPFTMCEFCNKQNGDEAECDWCMQFCEDDDCSMIHCEDCCDCNTSTTPAEPADFLALADQMRAAGAATLGEFFATKETTS